MALLDLLGRRWALRIIWELRSEPATFRDLQQRCGGMSASVLNQRLFELRLAGAVRQTDAGFMLTPEGQLLLEVYPPLQAWAQRWAERTSLLEQEIEERVGEQSVEEVIAGEDGQPLA